MDFAILNNYFSSYIRVIDILLGLVIVWGGYKGYKKGFLLEILSTVIFVAGILLLFFILSKTFTSTEEYVGNVPRSTAFGVYIVIYIVAAVLLNSLGRQLQDKIDYSILDDFDNFAGMFTGALKHAIFLSIFIWLFDAVGLKLPAEITNDSLIYPRLLAFHDWLIDVGATVAPSLGEMARDIKKLLRD